MSAPVSPATGRPLTMGALRMRLDRHLMEGRVREKLTQEQVADHLDVSARTFRRWESGAGEPKLVQLFRWADLVKVDIWSEPRPQPAKSDRLSADAGAPA